MLVENYKHNGDDEPYDYWYSLIQQQERQLCSGGVNLVQVSVYISWNIKRIKL